MINLKKKISMSNLYYTFYKTHDKNKGDDKDLYTVGYYDENGKWFPESDHYSLDNAILRVDYINKYWKGIHSHKICQWEFWRIIRAEYQRFPNILSNYYHSLFFTAIRLAPEELLLLEASYPGLVNVVEAYNLDLKKQIL